MMRVEIDRLLEYLVTGEDEDLVRQCLPLQPDGPGLVARARAAIDLLSPERVDARVRQRIAGLQDLLSKRARKLRSGPGIQRSAWAPTRPLPSAREDGATWADKADRLEAPRLASPEAAIATAARAGARRIVRPGEVLLDKPRVGLPDEESLAPTMSVLAPEPLSNYDMVMEASGAGYPGRCQLQAGEAGTVDLWHETRDGTDCLLVQVRGRDPVSLPMPVTWLPREGAVVRTSTDGAGIAALPWPAAGRGILRIDAARTIEIKIQIRV